MLMICEHETKWCRTHRHCTECEHYEIPDFSISRLTNPYSKKYILEKIEEFNGQNPMYEDMEGVICYPVYFRPGERGWFLFEEKYGGRCPHRVHTSVIKDVEYVGERIIVTTQNTRFTFGVCK